MWRKKIQPHRLSSIFSNLPKPLFFKEGLIEEICNLYANSYRLRIIYKVGQSFHKRDNLDLLCLDQTCSMHLDGRHLFLPRYAY